MVRKVLPKARVPQTVYCAHDLTYQRSLCLETFNRFQEPCVRQREDIHEVGMCHFSEMCSQARSRDIQTRGQTNYRQKPHRDSDPFEETFSVVGELAASPSKDGKF